MAGTCPDKGTLLLHAEGELPGHEEEEVASHVAACGACAETVSRLRGLSAALRRAGGHGGSRLRPGAGTPGGPWRSGTCPDPATIARYVEGSLEAGRVLEVEEHLMSCRACLAEVVDLWAMSGPADHDAPDGAVARVLARLERESRTAVLRWAERSIELVTDFASAWAADVGGPRAFVPEPAVATSRSSGADVRLHWRGEGGAAVEGVVRGDGRAASLTGRVTVEGDPAATVSAFLSSDSGTVGPESPDADGRFGPWALAPGENELWLTGLPAAAGSSARLVIILAVPGKGTEESAE